MVEFFSLMYISNYSNFTLFQITIVKHFHYFHLFSVAVPDPPQDFEAVETERGITLSWNPPITPVTGYKVSW